MFAGTQEYAQQCGRWECTIDPHPELILEAKGSEQAYDGIIARATPRLAAAARLAGVPLVNVWFNSPVTDAPLVSPDLGAVGRMAARHLMARGFRQFGFLGFSRQRSNKICRDAFKATLSEAGFSCSSLMAPASYMTNSSTWRGFSVRLDEWIDSWALPIGVCISYDTPCRHLATACRRKNVEIPRDAALIGTHNDMIICANPAWSQNSTVPESRPSLTLKPPLELPIGRVSVRPPRRFIATSRSDVENQSGKHAPGVHRPDYHTHLPAATHATRRICLVSPSGNMTCNAVEFWDHTGAKLAGPPGATPA